MEFIEVLEAFHGPDIIWIVEEDGFLRGRLARNPGIIIMASLWR